MKYVLLPGLDGTGDLFEPFRSSFGNETITISYPNSENLSYENLVNLVYDKLPKEEFVLVGESFSGYIAYKVALMKPDFLKAVVFVASFLEAPRPYVLKLSSLLPRQTLLSLSAPEIFVRTFLFNKSASASLLEKFKSILNEVPPSTLSFRLSEIEKLSFPIEKCQTPAIYIQAANDKLVPAECAGRFRELFNDFSIFRINGPHFIMQCNPEGCAEALSRAGAS